MAEVWADILTVFHAWRPTIGAALTLFGGLLCLIGTVGVMRFPDFYTRLHAASVTDTSGAVLVLFGMALMSPHVFVLIKLLAIFIFLFLTSPTASHAVANAAHTAGVQPMIGRFGPQPEEDEA